MIDREKQIELMRNVEERTAGYLRAWLADPEFRDALHRYDRCDDRDGGRRRASGAR